MTAAMPKTAAIITLRKPGQYSTSGRKAIAAWLRNQARNLERFGKAYNDAGDFRARYLYGR